MAISCAVTKALETPELLETVLSYVPPEDLKNARAVAKLWRDESLDYFRSGLIYVVDPETEAKRMLQLTVGMNSTGGFSLGQKPFSSTALPLSTTLYGFEDKPIKKYRLMEPLQFPPPAILINSACVSYKKMRYFWERCAPHLTYLDLRGASYFHVSSFIDGLIWLLKACPNLEELRLAPFLIWEWDMFFEEDEDTVTIDFTQKIEKNLAPKVTALSIDTRSVFPEDRFPYQVGPILNSERLRRCVFNLMPNLKRLSVDGTYYLPVMNALLQKPLTTNQIIQLKSFECNGEGTSYFGTHLGLVSLMKYLELLNETMDSGCLKSLTLMKTPFKDLWQFPRLFRNVLFCIRKRIERLCIGLSFFYAFEDEPPHHCKFDLFNFIFPAMTELILELEYENHSYVNYIFFDFSVFRGTPNLTRVRIDTLNIPNRFWLRRKLTPQNLLFGENGEKWHEIEGVRKGEETVRINTLEGDGSETFDPEEEGNEIVLEKMNDFHFTGRFATEALFLLGKWMKNLKEIAVIFDEETISIPFVVWPGTLRKMTVLGASFEGEGISDDLMSNLREMYPEIEIILMEQELAELTLEDSYEDCDRDWIRDLAKDLAGEW